MELLSCLSALKSTQGVLKDSNFIAQKILILPFDTQNATTTIRKQKKILRRSILLSK